MNDKNSEVKKPVKNQLFNVAVTGGTFEDFSQNAVLFPAQEVAVPPTVNTPMETPADLLGTQSIQLEPQEISLQEYQQEECKDQSSVFSSFSNVLSFGGPAKQYNPPSVPFKVDAPSQNIDPIPLFSTNAPIPSGNLVPQFGNPPTAGDFTPTAPPQGSSNLYRRSGLKKPTYAQLPGLTSVRQPTPGVLPIATGITSINKPISPTFLTSPSFSQPPNLNQSLNQTPSNYFQPISREGASPNTSLRTTPQYTSDSQITSASSSILEPVDPSTVGNSITFDSSAKPLFTPVTYPSLSSTPQPSQPAFLTPSVTPSPAVPFYNPVSYTPGFPTPVFPNTDQYRNMQSSTSTNANQNVQSFTSNIYRPVYHHWFHKRIVEGKTLWIPFSMIDSLALEEGFTSADISVTTVVATDGGRYDVNILRRERSAVYWIATPTEVRRCSWFHKGHTDGRFVPYEENIANMLEEEFRTAFETNEWHRKVELPNGDAVVFHGADVLVLFPPTQSPTDPWGNTPQTQPKPRVVKRGLDEFDIDEGESPTVDHLLFIVHGIGAVCDLKFRTVEEVVDEFRSISLQLVRSHYRTSCDNQVVNRIEVLPISWHSRLHSEDTGIDKTLKNITLKSIPRLRDFTNDTLLDILFYTSPMYCQTIITTVGSELNRIFEMFKHRNPTFAGGISVGGHSLGSLILFDLLSHQQPAPEVGKEEFSGAEEDVVAPLKKPNPKDRRLSRRISYMMSAAGTGQPQLDYPNLHFQPTAFFAMGSPIGMFVTVRGLDKLGREFSLPTCPAFFNIFHPYDPVAYRIESLINSELANLKPVLIPHHKGRKRMHLELKETMARVSADLKQKILDSMKNTWNTFYQMTIFGSRPYSSPTLEAEVAKVLEERLAEEQEKREPLNVQLEEDQYTNLSLGNLNRGRRIDYVLQEAPLESFNEYLFALTSHVGYWESEDTMLMILKEIYNSMGICADNEAPQSMTPERPNSTTSSGFTNQPSTSTQSSSVGMDPTIPPSLNTNICPPPTSGFVRSK